MREQAICNLANPPYSIRELTFCQAVLIEEGLTSIMIYMKLTLGKPKIPHVSRNSNNEEDSLYEGQSHTCMDTQ